MCETPGVSGGTHMIGEKECSDVFPQSHAFRMETEGVALIHTYSGCVHDWPSARDCRDVLAVWE